jgi:hypothetical protein
MYVQYTDEKDNQIFLIYQEIQSGAVAKSYMRKGFLIYEEMRKYLRRHLQLLHSEFLIYEENLISFLSVYRGKFRFSPADPQMSFLSLVSDPNRYISWRSGFTKSLVPGFSSFSK